MSAVFPSSVATALQLLTAINNTKVTLTVNAGIADTTLTVDDASALPTSGYVTFDDNDSSPETISYTGKTATNLTGVTRAADGTTAAAHVAASHLEMRWNAAYHNTLTTEVIAVEQYLSDRFGIASNPVVPSGKNLTLAATTNQLVLGTTNTTTISSTAPASSRTYTIPDAGGAASFVMTAGTQTVGGAKTFSSAVIINPVTNQIVLGVTNTTTISATAPASSVVYTIPDAGGSATFILSTGGATLSLSTSLTVTATTNQLVLGTTRTVTISAVQPASTSRTWTVPDITGNGTFAALEGTQTFSGAKTFSATLTMSGATIAMGANKITGLANGTAATDAAAFGQINAGFQPIVQATTTTQTLGTSSTLTAATNFSAAITPTSSSHRIKVTISGVAIATISGSVLGITVKRGSTDLSGGVDFVEVRAQTSAIWYFPFSYTYIDSPASTSALTYAVFFHNNDNTSSCGIVGTNVNTIILEEIV